VNAEPSLSLVQLTELVFAPVEKFAAGKDEAAAALATAKADGGTIIPAEGLVIVYATAAPERPRSRSTGRCGRC
jgi:hypothetical protein